jgi:putative transposase
MSNNESMTVLKLRLTPDSSIISILDGQSKICNYLYNHLLEQAQVLRSEFIKSQNPKLSLTIYSERGLRNLIPSLKEEKSFLKAVHSSPLKNVALRLSEAIQAHQKSKKGKRKGNVVGWPGFRSWKKNWFSLLYDEPNKGFKVESNKLILSLGMGEERKQRSVQMPIEQAELLKGKDIRNLRIVKQLGQFYAVFTVRTELPLLKPISKIIALDPNHKNLAYGVDTEGNAIEIKAPHWLKSYDKRIDELKAKRDRCVRKSTLHVVLDHKGNPTEKSYYNPSNRWNKYNELLKKVLQKRREQTKTFLYTAAHYLYKRYDCVGIGDYTPNGEGITTKMRRAMNNRSLIGRFKETLAWVGKKSGKMYLEYNEKGTTRTCNRCDHVVEGGIPLANREWTCLGCKAHHIRDENAAINGLIKILRNLIQKGEGKPLQESGSDLVLVIKRWAWCVLPSGVHNTLRGQNSEIIAAAGN